MLYKTKSGGILYEISGSWNGSDTISTFLSSIKNLEVGNFVFIVNGQGAGKYSFIKEIKTSTNEIVLEDSIGGSGSIYFVVDTYKKVNQSITQYSDDYIMLNLPQGLVSSWIQFRILMKNGSITRIVVQGEPNNTLQ